MSVRIERLGADFAHWEALLALILRSFAAMDGVIDPPSSALRLTPEALRDKARDETGFVAIEGEAMVGCVFAAERGDHIYLGKLAIAPDHQGSGLGARLLAAVEEMALARGKPVIELQTRIELSRNHRFFQRTGFRETARTSHEGYDRPTTITLRKELGI